MFFLFVLTINEDEDFMQRLLGSLVTSDISTPDGL